MLAVVLGSQDLRDKCLLYVSGLWLVPDVSIGRRCWVIGRFGAVDRILSFCFVIRGVVGFVGGLGGLHAAAVLVVVISDHVVCLLLVFWSWMLRVWLSTSLTAAAAVLCL